MQPFKNFDALDADMQAVIKQLLRFNSPPVESLDYITARSNPSLKNAVEEMASHSTLVRTMNVAKPVLPEQVDRVKQRLIPTRDGVVNARVFFPKTNKSSLPVIVYFHGGGWVIADLNSYEPSCRALCHAAEAIVISVAYRQAPENKFPAAVEDAYDALQWVLHNAQLFGGDPTRVAVAGESAGGNLAAVSCLVAKDLNGDMPVAQLLIYPVTDTSMTQASYDENEEMQPLHSSMMSWFLEHYLSDENQVNDPYVAPLKAESLEGLPPAIIITAEFDPLRDEAEAYATRLKEAGVPVKWQRFTGVTHEFFGLSGAVGKARDAVHFATESLKEIFDGKTEGATSTHEKTP